MTDQDAGGDGSRPSIYVVEQEDGWLGQCAGPGCSGPDGRPFFTSGWPERKHATDRIREHRDEHELGRPMTPLDEFRSARGVGVNDQGKAFTIPAGAKEVK